MVKNAKGKKVGLSLVYPPAHLYHILFELFKNSMRATVETHGKSRQLPEIEVLVAKGEHDVSIRVSDQVQNLNPFCHVLMLSYSRGEVFLVTSRITCFTTFTPRHLDPR